MSKTEKQNLALRIYRRLAHAFPHEFKLIYGLEVIQTGEDAVEEIYNRHGAMGLLRLIADIAVRVPIEYLSEMRRDMAYAVRALIKSPGFALVGIISLGIGMGVTTTVYTTVYSMMFRPLPGALNPKEMVVAQSPVSYPYIEEYRQHKDLVADAAAFQNGVPFNVGFEGAVASKPERLFGHLVSANYFSLVGVQPQAGRFFSPDIDKAGNAPVVVISDRFWRNRLHAAPDAVGRTLRLNGQIATIVGIGPAGFNGAMPFVPAELFVPITVPPSLAPELSEGILQKRDAKVFLSLVRTAPGITFEAEEAGLDTITRNLDDQDAKDANASRLDKTRRVTLLEGGTPLPIPRKLKPVLIGFYALLIGLIMTIACMNLANMLLSRAAARRRELAIRIAVGASRFRLIRQMLSEGVLLALLAGTAGLSLAWWFMRLTAQMKLPLAVPVEFSYSLDWGALAFTFGLAIVCGIGFSLAPALQSTKADIAPTLKEGAGVELRNYRRFGMRNLLVVGQVAGSLMLLLITGFVVLGFSKTSGMQTRFDPRTMYLLSIDPVRDGYSAEKAQALFEKLPERLRSVGAVRSVALAEQPPFSIPGGTAALSGSMDNSGKTQTVKSVAKESVGAGYFAALDEPILAGREFDERDQRVDTAAAGVAIPVILNQSAARGLFSTENPVGQRTGTGKTSYEVIGVVHDLKSGIATAAPSSILYLPLTRRDFASPPAGGMTIMVRAVSNGTTGAGVDAMSGIRREFASIDPNLALFDVRTLDEYFDISKSYMRVASNLYGGIGVFGLILAAIGLAGVTAYSVARRRKEIGIRMALGSSKGQVLWLVLREGTVLVMIGTALGFLGAVGMAKGLSSLTSIFVDAFQFGVNDPRLLIGAPVLLAGLAMLACYIPALRSTKIDPLKALREE
jgi:predicted permease